MDDVIYQNTQLWVALVVSIFTTIGTLITIIFNARKTNAETQRMMAENKKLLNQTASLKQGQDEIASQFVNNGGGSMKDSTDEIKELIHETRSDLRGIRRDIGRLQAVDAEDRQRAVREHERFYEALKDVKDDLYMVRDDLHNHVDDVPQKLKQHQAETLKLIEERRNAP